MASKLHKYIGFGDTDGVDCMWQVLETTLVQCHGLRSEGYQRPAATTRLAAEEPRRDPVTGGALNRAYTLACLPPEGEVASMAWYGCPAGVC